MKDSVKSTAIFYGINFYQWAIEVVDREEKKTDRSTSALTFPKLDKISYIVNQRPFQVDRPVVANAK